MEAVLAGEDAPDVARRVGELQLLVVDLLTCPDPWGALDSSNDSIAHIGDTVFDANTGQLSERLDGVLGRAGHRVLVLDRVELEPAWQGHNVAALLAAEALDHLRTGCRVALCLPGPLDRTGVSAEEYDEAVRRMQGVWKQVGFRPFDDGVWLLEPSGGTLDERLASLREQPGSATVLTGVERPAVHRVGRSGPAHSWSTGGRDSNGPRSNARH